MCANPYQEIEVDESVGDVNSGLRRAVAAESALSSFRVNWKWPKSSQRTELESQRLPSTNIIGNYDRCIEW
jgi:hypothetical protein